MNPFYKLISVFISIFSFLTYHSLGLHPYYRDCEPRLCGSVTITYPFYISGLQKSICGHQGFEVTCNSKHQTIINLSNDTYFILEILYDIQSIVIINTAIRDVSLNCTALGIHSFILDEKRFEFAVKHNEVFLLQGCNEKIMKGVGEYREQSCISSNTSSNSVIAIYPHGRSLNSFAGDCKKVVSVPYQGQKSQNNDIDSALRYSVQLKWNAGSCRDCAKSGGRCGHSETNSQMQCYCPDGVYPHKCSEKRSWHLILGLGLGGVVLVFLALLAIWHRKTLKFGHSKFTAMCTKRTAMNQNVEAFLKTYKSFAPKRYSYTEIRIMTCNFKDKLGEGGFGAVYKGELQDSRLVAVKKLKKLKGDGGDFINEVVSMGRTNHVNIVTLLGFCFEGNKRALVFEFLPNGSLDKFIYSSASGQSLPSDTLFSIAIGIAKGLDYLHKGCNTRILHFDIKPRNILLDEDLHPKISDFGLARLCSAKDSLISMSEARGTIGYIAPEVFCRNFGGVSHKSDVYSYGMMLLDMVCGRNNVVAEAQRSSDMYFPDWIYSRLELRDEIENDEIMRDDETKKLQRKMILVGLLCIQSYPSNRPPMNRVLEMLEGELESLQMPPKPHISSPPNPIFDSSKNSILSNGSEIFQG